MLTAALSRALVALTIELDGDFEERMPHRTTRGGGRGPWLTSWVMWQNCLRWLGDDGLPEAELERLARTPTNLDGMRRWGYVVREGGMVRLTPAGRRAAAVWEPLAGELEARRADAAALRAPLEAVDERIGIGLPDCLPILGHGLCCTGRVTVGDVRPDRDRSLPALLSRVPLAPALAYERGSRRVSLAVGANVLRLLGDEPVPVRELPSRSGVSKEAIAMAVGYLERHDLAVMESDGRVRTIRLTAAGTAARVAHVTRLDAVEAAARERLGTAPLEDALAGLDVSVAPRGWRTRAPAALPDFPMVLHRGGFPDGS